MNSINGSFHPFSIKSEIYKSHNIPKNQEIIGFYFNQHLEFGNESEYMGDSSCFIFRYSGDQIKAFKPNSGKSKYFRTSSQGIFIGLGFIFVIGRG
jgi:hypothetical protein